MNFWIKILIKKNIYIQELKQNKEITKCFRNILLKKVNS